MLVHATNPENSSAAPATEPLVSGMTCNNCARHVTEAIQSVPGVRSVAVAPRRRKD